MKCPLHRNIEMKEHREMVPFMHMAKEDGGDTAAKRQWRVACKCPIPGCHQVGVVKTEYAPVKLSTSMALTH